MRSFLENPRVPSADTVNERGDRLIEKKNAHHGQPDRGKKSPDELTLSHGSPAESGSRDRLARMDLRPRRLRLHSRMLAGPDLPAAIAFNVGVGKGQPNIEEILIAVRLSEHCRSCDGREE